VRLGAHSIIAQALSLEPFDQALQSEALDALVLMGASSSPGAHEQDPDETSLDSDASDVEAEVEDSSDSRSAASSPRGGRAFFGGSRADSPRSWATSSVFTFGPPPAPLPALVVSAMERWPANWRLQMRGLSALAMLLGGGGGGGRAARRQACRAGGARAVVRCVRWPVLDKHGCVGGWCF
jgi:hypothetical protein